jgi:hypothetical protein
MAQAGNGLYGSIKAAVIRVARLDASCSPISGSINGAASKAVIMLQAQAEYETGEEFTQKNGLGDLMISVKDNDKLKRMNLTMELATRDFELLEIMTGATLLTSGGTTFGVSRRGTSVETPNPVSVEIWTKVATSSGSCVATGSGQWFRNVYPKVVWTLGDTDFGNSIATVKMTGVAEGNPNWGANGPFNDWNYTAIPNDTPEAWVLDSYYSSPATVSGSGGVLPAALGGYLLVPGQ